MVNKNKKFLAGAIILAMSISTITQTSYASEAELGVDSDIALDRDEDINDKSNDDFGESETDEKESNLDAKEENEIVDEEEIDSPVSEDDLEDSKKSLKNDINLSDLSERDKEDYSKKIDDAQSKKDLEEIETQFNEELAKEDSESEGEGKVTSDGDAPSETSNEDNEESSDVEELAGANLEELEELASDSNLDAKKEDLRSKLVGAMASGKIDPMELSEFTEKVGSAESDEALKTIEAEIYQALGEELPEEDSETDLEDSETEQAEDDLAEERQIAKDQIDEVAAEKNMPADLVNEYYARIDAANSMDDLFNITVEANGWENQDDTELEVDPIQEARETYYERIDELENLDEERKAYYKAEIDKASDGEEFMSIMDDAQAENNDNAPVEDFDFKGIYKDLIDELEYLSEDQKQGFKDQIDAIDEEVDGAEEAIHEIWISAQTQNEGQEPIEDEEDLNSLRDVAKSVVDELENLSEEEKQAFKDQIDAEKSFAGMDGILDKAKDQDENNAANREWLESLREGYIAKLPGYENLTDDQRAAYEKQFKEAKDQEAMRLIDYDAQLTNINQEPDEEVSDEDVLDDYKDLALEEIEALENLTDEKVKEDFLNQIKAVKLGQGEDAFINATKAIDAIRAEAAAWQASDNSLDKDKERAKAEINGLDKLTEAEKQKYLGEVDQAENLDDINKAVEEAKAINDARLDLEKAKEAGKAAINALDKLTEAEKQQYINQVDQASDKETINKAVEEAKALNDAKSNLEDAKKSAKETVDNLANLTSDQKEGYLGQIDNADSKEEIDGIVADAKAKDFENLTEAKEDAKASIDELSKINEDKKQSYKEEIDKPSTDTIAKVNEIVNRAKNDSSEGLPEEDALKAYKDEYKKMIDSLPTLRNKEKESFKKAIDNANSIDQIKSIYNNALEIVASRNNSSHEDLDYLRNYIIDRINELENLRDSSKEDFIAKVKDANTFESIFDVYRQAIRMDMQANGMIYVPIGFEFIESGYYYRSDLYNNRSELLKAYRDNKITVAAAKILLENYPNTVKNVKNKLEKLVKESEELQKQAEAMLKEYDEILILDYKAEI